MATFEINDKTLKTVTALTDEFLIQETAGGTVKKSLLEPLQLDSTNNTAGINITPVVGVPLSISDSGTGGNLLCRQSSIEIGSDRTADGTSFIDFWSWSSASDNDARIIRGSGQNGLLQIINKGSGGIEFLVVSGDVYTFDPFVTGASASNSSAQLQADSTTKGFLPPRMSTTQRDAITTPATGLVIYNTTTNVLNFYNGTVWGAV